MSLGQVKFSVNRKRKVRGKRTLKEFKLSCTGLYIADYCILIYRRSPVYLLSTIRPTLSHWHVQLTAEAACLSLGAVLVIFVLIVVRSISFQQCHPVWRTPAQRNVRRYKKTLPNGDWKLLQTPTDIYMARFTFP
jgi:hypothetical protein